MTSEKKKEKKYGCTHCGKHFTFNADLKKHVRIHTGERPFHCDKCGKRFTQGGGLKNHILSRHDAGSTSFSCFHCGKTFPVKERLRLHLRVHTGERPFSCRHCPKKFARSGQLIQHERTHSGNRPFQCQRCLVSFTSRTNLKIHIKRHLGEKEHVCHECGKRFTRRDGLQKHLDCFHANQRSFTCNICNREFKGHLLQHLRTHLHEKPHSCNECGTSFAQRSQLTVHLRVHSGEKPYSCPVCRQPFAHSTALKMHVRLHTGEKPFKCLLCSSSFVQLPHLKKHMLCVHKTNKPYLCLGCRSFFKTKNELLVHQEQDNCKPKKEEVKEDFSINSSGKQIEIQPVMSLNKMRTLLAILLKRISTQSKLESLGFGRRLIDEVLKDSIISSGREPCLVEDLDQSECLKRNVEILLEWTIPKMYMDRFRRERRSTEELLEELTS